MPASPARVAANQANAQKSMGPKTDEGKARSRGNALKHGLTGAGVVLTDEDAAEVARVVEGIQTELAPSGVIGHALARRVATQIVRLDRCVAQEAATLSDRVREALDGFKAPEGADPSTVDRLRAEAGARAMFDPSKEATLARKYEAAAKRGLYRALKELRQLARDSVGHPQPAPAPEVRPSPTRLGSFFPAEPPPQPIAPRPAPAAPNRFDRAPEPLVLAPSGAFDLPFSIGRPR